jgi:hypothetical protein
MHQTRANREKSPAVAERGPDATRPRSGEFPLSSVEVQVRMGHVELLPRRGDPGCGGSRADHSDLVNLDNEIYDDENLADERPIPHVLDVILRASTRPDRSG